MCQGVRSDISVGQITLSVTHDCRPEFTRDSDRVAVGSDCPLGLLVLCAP
jgi:hypothetical protein